MNLRPHHLLCIQKFTGHGYSPAFTAHMTEIVGELTKNPHVTLVQGCDELCSACPHNAGGKCASLEKVDGMDGAVLELCGLPYGEAASWAVLSKCARERIFETEEFTHVCGGCQWYGLCKKTEIIYEKF